MVNPTIVIAEDSKVFRYVLADYIGDLGYTLVGEAKNGLEAIQMVANLKPNIAILDVYMPEMNGYDACEVIQKKLGIPTILITGSTSESSIDKIVQAAPAGIIIKPFDLYQFKSTVDLVYSNEESQISLKRYKNIVQKTPMLFSLIDQNYKYILINDYYCECFQKKEEEIVGKTIAELLGQDVFENTVKQHIDEALSGNISTYEAWFNYKAIGKRYMSVTYSPFSEKRGGISNGVVVFSNDNTQLKLSEEKLELLSSTDQLTNINNRRRFMEFLDNEIEISRRFGHSFLFLSMDVDDFKSINDTYGHMVGDKALMYVANILKNTLRQVDHIGRIGGEEFAAIITKIDEDNIKPFLDRVINSFNTQCFSTAEVSLKITVSIGAFKYTDCSVAKEDLLRKTDDALYQAKHNGKNQYCIHKI